MNETYKAIEITRPGEFLVTRKPLQEPGPDQVRIRVEACGVCHSDSGTVAGLFPIDWPRVPGVVIGGKNDPDARYLDPTIVYPVSWEDPIMQDEIFGPILPILTYRTRDEAFDRISAAPHPLAAFIFSRDQKTIDRFVGELSFGGGAVNQVNIHLFVESMPFGGVGPSGMGHYYGKYGFDMLTHAKSMFISPPDVAIEHLFPPYSPEKNDELKIWFEY